MSSFGHSLTKQQQVMCVNSDNRKASGYVIKMNESKSNMPSTKGGSSTSLIDKNLYNTNNIPNDPKSMLKPHYHSKYSHVSVIDGYRNSFGNMGRHCYGSEANTAPNVQLTNPWGQQSIDTEDHTNIVFSTNSEYCHYQKGRDSTGVFYKVYHNVDYSSINSSKCYDNIIYVYPHANIDIKGFYYLCNRSLYDCPVLPEGNLCVYATSFINILVECCGVHKSYSKLVMNDFCKEKYIQETFQCSYNTYMENVIDYLISKEEINLTVITDSGSSDCDNIVDYELDRRTTAQQLDSYNCHIPNGIAAHMQGMISKNAVGRDANESDKVVGFISHKPSNFKFVGPDRKPQVIDNIDKCLTIAKTIQSTGVPNYQQARIPLKLDLNIEQWELELKDYPDTLLIEYLKFGFPLSLVALNEFNNTHIINHFSATQHPEEVERYLHTETERGAMLGPINQVDSNAFHCSPLLSRPKDGNKRRIILNLSYPHGASVNDHVQKKAFDKNNFTLRKLKELKHVDPLLYKIDVARAFRNLRVNPADAVKLGIAWKGQFYLDLCVAFGWTHGSAAFQRLSDALVYIMQRHAYVLHAYIDDYIGIAPAETANRQFEHLMNLLNNLGLPMNPDKRTPPTKALTCLGIHIDINKATLSIEQAKLEEIFQECVQVLNRKYLSRKKFQSLLGKLIYLHKCVLPARIFVNRILELYRQNTAKKKIYLTGEFFKDIAWFITFLKQFNGTTRFEKPLMQDCDTLFLDACLTGLGGIWANRVYAVPAPTIPRFELKIVHLEMVNIVAMHLWGKYWHNSKVIFTATTRLVSKW